MKLVTRRGGHQDVKIDLYTFGIRLYLKILVTQRQAALADKVAAGQSQVFIKHVRSAIILVYYFLVSI